MTESGDESHVGKLVRDSDIVPLREDVRPNSIAPALGLHVKAID